MKAEIISIGSEITCGQNLDTNSQWLSLRLAEMGIHVGWHTTIADDLQDNVQAFRIASQRASLVLTTGGLGPTLDDLTREVMAQVGGVDLVEHEPSWQHIQQLFARRQRPMPDRNRVQALLPAGAEALFNPIGTAPGIWMKLDDATVAAMPGVPSEMRLMFEHEVQPRLHKLGMAQGVRLQRKINTFGLGEAQVDEKLQDLTRRGHVPEVGITASDAIISLRIWGQGATQEDARAQTAPVEATIRQRLGDLVYGVDDEQLQDVVVRLLAEHKKSLATAESVTGGLVAHRITEVPGASAWLRGGIVAYDTRVKVQMLGVPQALIDQYDVISPQVVEAMAVGCRKLFNTDLAVSTVGLAGPGQGDSEKPVGLVYVGLAWDGGVSSHQFSWAGTRHEVQSRTAKLALNRIRLHLMGVKG